MYEKDAQGSGFDAGGFGSLSVDEKDEDAVSVPQGGITSRNGRVRVQEVWRDIFLSSNGRDKGLVSSFCVLANLVTLLSPYPRRK